jgi:hypothetical protein
MTTGEEIRQAIRHIIAQYLVTTKLREPKMCKVIAVYTNPGSDAMVCDCEPIDKTAIIKNVNLSANYPANKAGFVLAPSVNSIVKVSFTDDQQAFVSMVSEVDFIYLNGNDYGGLVQVQPLVDKINALETLVNGILGALKSTTIPLASSGTYPFAPLYLAYNAITPTTQKADLENTTVIHGAGNLS